MDMDMFSRIPGFAGAHASTRFAHAHQPKLAPACNAPCPVVDWCEGASCCWIARVFGARTIIVTDHRREVARTGHKIANAFSAVVAVVFTQDVFAEVLSAHAGYTDAGKAIEGAAPTVGDRIARTATTAAILPSALVVVGWAHHPCTRVAVENTQVSKTPDQWHRTQRADTYKSD